MPFCQNLTCFNSGVSMEQLNNLCCILNLWFSYAEEFHNKAASYAFQYFLLYGYGCSKYGSVGLDFAISGLAFGLDLLLTLSLLLQLFNLNVLRVTTICARYLGYFFGSLTLPEKALIFPLRKTF